MYRRGQLIGSFVLILFFQLLYICFVMAFKNTRRVGTKRPGFCYNRRRYRAAVWGPAELASIPPRPSDLKIASPVARVWVKFFC